MTTSTEIDVQAGHSTTETHRDTEFFNQHDGIHGRAPGTYLDVKEREQAEVIRAKAEDREPDLEHDLPATAGTPLVVKEKLQETAQSVPRKMNDDPELVATLPVDHTSTEEANAAAGRVDTSFADQIARENEVRRENAE